MAAASLKESWNDSVRVHPLMNDGQLQDLTVWATIV